MGQSALRILKLLVAACVVAVVLAGMLAREPLPEPSGYAVEYERLLLDVPTPGAELVTYDLGRFTVAIPREDAYVELERHVEAHPHLTRDLQLLEWLRLQPPGDVALDRYREGDTRRLRAVARWLAHGHASVRDQRSCAPAGATIR